MTYVDDLDRVMGIQRYNGCIIKPMGEGKWEALGKTFYSLDSAQNYIDQPIKDMNEIATGIFAGSRRLKDLRKESKK
jgi:hypothetical protein